MRKIYQNYSLALHYIKGIKFSDSAIDNLREVNGYE